MLLQASPSQAIADGLISINLFALGKVSYDIFRASKHNYSYESVKRSITALSTPLLISTIASAGILIGTLNTLRHSLITENINQGLHATAASPILGDISIALLFISISITVLGFKLLKDIRRKRVERRGLTFYAALLGLLNLLVNLGAYILIHVTVYEQQLKYNIYLKFINAYDAIFWYLFGFTVLSGMLCLLFIHRIFNELDESEPQKMAIAIRSAVRYGNLFPISFAFYIGITSFMLSFLAQSSSQ